MKYPNGTAKLEEMKRGVSGVLKENPNGVSHKALQKMVGIGDPNTEAERPKVWKLISAIAGLYREGFLKSFLKGNERVYLPVGA